MSWIHFQRGISIIGKEMAKNQSIHAKRNRHTEHEQRHGSAHEDEDFNIKSLQRTMMMKRITEQITDVSRGNTAALVVIKQFL